MSGGTWRVVDPRTAARRDTRVVQVDVPHFGDETDYEAIMGRHLTAPAWDDFFRSGGVVVLATGAGMEGMRVLARGSGMAGERGVRAGIERLALERQIVALRRL